MTLLRTLVSLFVFSVAVLWSGPALADVRCVQEVLSKTVFDPGPVDGLWGKNTANAARDFLIYRDGELSVEVAKSNSDALCQTVSDEGRDHEPLKLRRYAIVIDASEIEELARTRVFNFDGVDIDAQLNKQNCVFNLRRENRSNGMLEGMGEGRFDIVEGMLHFGEHRWFAGDHADDDKFLKEQTKLGILQNGKIVGKLRFFHLFHVPGASYEPPKTVIFDGSEDTVIGIRTIQGFGLDDPVFDGQFSYRCPPDSSVANVEQWYGSFKDVLRICESGDFSSMEGLDEGGCAKLLIVGLQSQLGRHNCRPGPVDGIYGSEMIGAMKRLAESSSLALVRCSSSKFGEETCAGFVDFLGDPPETTEYEGQWSDGKALMFRALYSGLKSAWPAC